MRGDLRDRDALRATLGAGRIEAVVHMAADSLVGESVQRPDKYYDNNVGEVHDPETHLIPLVLQAAAGLRPALTVFGDDYPTPDGTCIRDYIHVIDLAHAHVLALGAVAERSCIYNLGCGGAGYSVRQVIEAARRVTGLAIPLRIGPRRPGDPAVLVASAAKIQSELGWQPRLGALDVIVASAWQWMQKFPGGYRQSMSVA